MCDNRTGKPARAGARNWLSATSSMPGSIDPPPVSTQPAPERIYHAPVAQAFFYVVHELACARLQNLSHGAQRQRSRRALRIGDLDFRQLRERR